MANFVDIPVPESFTQFMKRKGLIPELQPSIALPTESEPVEEDYVTKALKERAETGGATPDLEGLLAFSNLQRQRQLEQALQSIGEQYGGYDFLGSARRKAMENVLTGYGESAAAERANLLAQTAQQQEAIKQSALSALLSQSMQREGFGQQQKGWEFGALQQGLGEYTPTGFQWKNFGGYGTGASGLEQQQAAQQQKWNLQNALTQRGWDVEDWAKQEKLAKELATKQQESQKKNWLDYMLAGAAAGSPAGLPGLVIGGGAGLLAGLLG